MAVTGLAQCHAEMISIKTYASIPHCSILGCSPVRAQKWEISLQVTQGLYLHTNPPQSISCRKTKLSAQDDLILPAELLGLPRQVSLPH